MEINEIHDISSFKNALHIDKTGARYYVRIRFKNIPLQSEFEEIESKGIKLLDYVPKNAYYCSIDTKAIDAYLSIYGVVSIDTIAINEKITPELIDRVPAWMNLEEGYVKLNIEYFKGISDFSTIAESLTGIGAEVLEHNEYFCKYYIRIKFDDIRRLASLPWVMYVDTDNKPLKTDNYVAGQSHTANALRLENSLGGRGLTGQGVKVGLFDNGVIGQHIDFDNRLTQMYQGNYGSHATHCMGTIGGAGKINIDALGMAPKVQMYSWGMGNYEGMHQGNQNQGIMITSNSYGYWIQSFCGEKGKYDESSRSLDKLTKDTAYFLHVFSAGNDGGLCNGWNTIGDGPNSSKNVITVGAITKTNSIGSFSSRGPVIDGRLKPEITAVGMSSYSLVKDNSYNDEYFNNSNGTSFSVPGVTGTIALLYERFMQLNSGNKPDASLIKGLVCNTADDLGNPGPDYVYGFGKINGLKAVRLIEQGNFYSDNISQSNVQSRNISIPANTGQLKVILCWTDKEALANSNPAIINNLDLKISLNGIDYYPLVLNPNNPSATATPGIDSLNVIEMVSINNPTQGNCVISVTGTSVPFGPQKYNIVYEIVNKAIELTYPMPKDRITPNIQQILRWNSYGLIDSVSIELSTNNGINWSLIAKVPASHTHYCWIPQGSQSTGQAKIRLSSGTNSFTMDSTFSIFPIPSNFTLSTGDDESINMQWTAVPNAIGYEIMKLNNEYNWEIIDTISQTNFSVSGLVNFNTYWFTITALGANGAKSQRLYAKSCQVITSFHPPQLLSPDNGEWTVELSPTFRWIKLRDIVSYQIQISTNNQFNQLIIDTLVNDSLFTCDSLEFSTEYFWRVRAIKQNVTTAWSEVWQFQTKDDSSIGVEENSSGKTVWAWGINKYAELGFYEYAIPTKVNEKKWRAIESGSSNSFGIDSAGYLWAWGSAGYNGEGTYITRYEPIQIGTSKWLSISFKGLTGHAIREDSTLWGWGGNDYGQIGDGTQSRRLNLVQIGTDTNWQTVASGQYHTIAIKNDGSLWAWGSNNAGQLGDNTTVAKYSPVRVGDQNSWKAISAGVFYSIAIKIDGSLWAWGLNEYGQLGNTAIVNRLTPYRIGNENNWEQISAGNESNHAIKNDGSLWAWGKNDFGQIGDGTTEAVRFTPVRIGVVNDWACVSSGQYYTVAVKQDGSVYSWGVNSWNKISNSDSLILYSPVLVKHMKNAKNASCYSDYALVIGRDSILYAWGANTQGQLGIQNAKMYYNTPTKIKNLTGIKRISSARSHSLIVTNSEKCYVFGNNKFDQIGLYYLFQPVKPTLLNDSIKPKRVFLGSTHNFIQTDNGVWYAWGGRNYGCLGDGSSGTNSISIPTQISLDITYQKIALGEYYSMGIKGNGTLWAWGYNNNGQLGDSTSNNSFLPKQITQFNNWKAVACGTDHTVAIQQDGSLWAWGDNNAGQLGDSSNINKNFPVRVGNQNDWDSVACGDNFTIARKTDGSLWAWGANGMGQLGIANISFSNTPKQIGNGTDWRTFSCGEYHTIALKNDGSLWAWGGNIYGQLGDESTERRFSPVRIGNKTDWLEITASGQASFAICSPSGFGYPTLLAPVNNKRISSNDTLFVWNSIPDATVYHFQLGVDTLFSNNIMDIYLADTITSLPRFLAESDYYWRVCAMNDFDTSAWSPIWKYVISSFNIQDIILNQGWNLISINMLPTDLNVSSIFSGPLANENLLLLSDNDLYLSPIFGLTSLSNYNTLKAYSVYMLQQDSIRISGADLTPQFHSIQLQTGWNTIPYLRNTPMSAETALATILPYIKIMQNQEGGQFVPSDNINTLETGTTNAGMMVPGKGYMIYVSQACTLTYPTN